MAPYEVAVHTAKDFLTDENKQLPSPIDLQIYHCKTYIVGRSYGCSVTQT